METRSARLVALVCVLTLALPPLAPAFQEEGFVRIGTMGELSGPIQAFGHQAFGGMKIALEEINGKGGVTVQGKRVPLKFVPEGAYDTQTNPATTLAMWKKSIEADSPLMVANFVSSGNTEALFKNIADSGTKVPTLSVISSAGKLSKITPYGFRWSIFEPEQIGDVLQKLNKQFGLKTAGLVVLKDERYSTLTAEEAFIPGAKKAGIQIVETVEILTKDTDVSAQVSRLKAANPDIVMLASVVGGAANILREAQRRGLKPKVWLGCNGTNNPELFKIAGPAAEGLVMRSGFHSELPRAADVAEKVKKLFNQDMNFWHSVGYESILAIAQAIEAAQLKNTRESLQEDREKFRDAFAKGTYFGFAGPIKFDAEREAGKPAVSVVYRGGKLRIWDEKELP